MRFEPTLLAILDIGGYTAFIRQRATTLPHAEAVITALLEAVIDGAETPLRLNKLEGDAALLWADAGPAPRAAAASVLRRIDAAFAAFDHRRAAIAQERSHCQCGACANIGALQIKAIAHFGEVAHKHVRGLHELAGEPVILLHRLLKNQVAAPRYVLMSAAFRDLLDDDPGPLAEAVEHPDGFEPLRVFVRAPAQAPAAGLNVNATPFMQ
jgi:class 3 adenylate cyclase